MDTIITCGKFTTEKVPYSKAVVTVATMPCCDLITGSNIVNSRRSGKGGVNIFHRLLTSPRNKYINKIKNNNLIGNKELFIYTASNEIAENG